MQDAGRYRKERIDRGIKARSDTIYVVSAFGDMLYLFLPRFVPLTALFCIPLFLGGGYWEKVLFYSCVFALLALSWDLMASVGLVSLGQALFFGVGSYVAGGLNHYLKWPIFITLPAATLGGALFCTILLVPVLRLKGVYFSMVTLILPLLLSHLIETLEILGGTHGLLSLSPFPSAWLATYLAVISVALVLFGFRRLMNEDLGIVLRGIKEDDRVVMAGAINVHAYKARAVFLAGMVGSFAGALMTHYYQFVGRSAFALDYTILPLASAVVGGPGSFAGATLGAFILVPLSEALRALGGLRIALYGVILIGALVLLPEGIFHYLARKYHQFEREVEI
ncbi:MAG: branched-chain amino acid ABC transporter permease [Thermodesulfobacteriota bacterium]